MQLVVPILIFLAVSGIVFAAGVVLDQRRERARLIRDRLNAAQAQATRGERLALLRDEMLSRIPAFDTLLRRSERISRLQTLLERSLNLYHRIGRLDDLAADMARGPAIPAARH